MQKRAWQFLFIFLLLVSFLLVTSFAALLTVGPIPAFAGYYQSSIGGHQWGIGSDDLDTSIMYDFHEFSVPISRWKLILLGWTVSTLICVVSTVVLAWHIVRNNNAKPES